MDPHQEAHVHSGALGLLAFPWAYAAVKRLLYKPANHSRLLTEIIRPFPGCRILDIGCGPADILSYLPEYISAYTGLDFNPRYIEFAQQRWSDRKNCRFECRNLNDLVAENMQAFDIVLALGLLHHISDADAGRLFRTVAELLKPGGRFITYDGVYMQGQNPVAKWLLAHDRGRAVRTEAGYLALARETFPETSGQILHDTLRVPYTIMVMTCRKPK